MNRKQAEKQLRKMLCNEGKCVFSQYGRCTRWSFMAFEVKKTCNIVRDAIEHNIKIGVVKP